MRPIPIGNDHLGFKNDTIIKQKMDKDKHGKATAKVIIIIFIYDSLTYDRSMHFGQYGWKNLFLFFVVVIFRFRHEPFGSQYNNTSGKGTFFTECPRISVQVL